MTGFYTHASITARPFFECRGYRLVREQQVERNGVSLTNYVMEKVKEYALESSGEERHGLRNITVYEDVVYKRREK